MTVKFFAGDQSSRSRSATPTGRRRRASTSRTRSEAATVSASELGSIKAIFPEVSSFKFISSWRPKKFLISKLLAVIDSVYAEMDSGDEFSESLMRHFQDKLGIRSLVEFHVLDLLSNCVAQRTRCMEVDIFVRFLERFYSGKDFAFFTFLRRTVACEQGALSLEDCERICAKLFRTADLRHTVMGTIRDEISKKNNSRSAHIQCDFFVYIALWVFHHQGETRATSPGTSSISDYVDSILMLKSQTHKQKHPKNILRESVQMEEVVNQMLADCCHGDKQAVHAADALMQAVMTEDAKNWAELGGLRPEFDQCLIARDNLLKAIEEGRSEGELERVLFEFCGKIAQTRVLREDRSSYRT